jgi:uncharacterized RDD family membrane protein YckC
VARMTKPTAVVGRRVAAFLIDALLLYAISFAIFFAMADTKEEIGRKVLQGDITLDETTYGNITIGDSEYAIVGNKFLLYLLIIFAIGFLYLAVFQGIKGWTLGKLVLGIRVVDESGRTGPGVGKGAIRWVLWIVDGFFFYLVAFITALTSDKNQRVGDMAAKTFVVGQKDVGRAPFAGAQPQFAGAQPQFAGAGVGAGAGAADGAGWHPDPHGQARLRYWDGSQWTEHTSA